METLKKLFASVTIFAMALLTLAPTGLVHAATALQDGDLIKASKSAVYYYKGGKRYVFPTETTYKTWYSDFSKVKTISDSELADIPMGTKNVVFRPGSYLVKVTTDPKVYAVGPNGALYWIKSEDAAKKLYGNDWAKRVKDVPDAFFTNYGVSNSVTIDGSTYPAGSLIKYNGSDDIYYINSEGKKQKFTGSAFADNGLMMKFVNTAPDSITFPNGSDITGKVDMLADTAQVVVTPTPTPAPTKSSLKVELAPDTPAAADIPAGSNNPGTNVPFAKFNFTAGSKDVKVTAIKVTRSGLSSDTDLTAVKLFDQDGNQLGTNQSFDANHRASFTNLSWVVPAGKTKSITVKGDSAANKSGRIKFGIDSADMISSDADSVSGSFPMFGNTMTQVANVDVGQLTIEKGPSDPTSTNVKVDEKNVRFLQVKLTASSKEDIKLNYITFRQGDSNSVSASDLANYTLYNDTTGKKVATVDMVNDRVTFKFNPPLLIKKGESVLLSLKADVVSGSGKNVSFSLTENDAWLMDAVGTNYGFGVSFSPAASTGVDFGNGTTSKSETEAVAVQQGTLTVSKGSNTPATGNIAKGADNVTIASWDFEAKGEKVKVGKVTITVDDGAGNALTAGHFTMFKLVDKDGNVWGGPYDITSNTKVVFPVQMIFPVGKTELFLKAKVSSSASGTIQAKFNPNSDLTTVKGETSNKTVSPTPSATVAGNKLTVKSAALIVSMGATPIAGDQIKGAKGAELATIVLNASSSGEDVKVTSITIKGNGNEDVKNLNNYQLWDGNTQIGETEEYANAGTTGTIVFNIDNGLIVKKNELKTLKVKADALNVTAGQNSKFNVSAVTAVGADSGSNATVTKDGTNNLPSNDSLAQTWKASGQLKINLDANTPVAQIVAAGTTSLEVARYKFHANSEDIDVTELNLVAGKTASPDFTANEQADNISQNTSAVKVYLDDKLVGTTQFGTDAKAKLTFNGGEFRIKKDQDHIVKIVVDLADKAVLASGKTFYVGIQEANGDGRTWGAAGNYKIVANGVASGATITQANIDSVGDGTGNVAGGKQFVAYDGILTVSLSANSPTGKLVQGANTEVLRLDLKATGDDIDVTGVDFTIAGSCIPDGTGAAYVKSADDSVTYWTWTSGSKWLQLIKEDNTQNPPIPRQDSLETKQATGTSTTLQVSAGATKTIKLVGDTSKATACTTGQTFQVSVQNNANARVGGGATASQIANGIEWKDQELGASVTATSPLIKHLPVYGNVLEI